MNKLTIIECQNKWRPEVFYSMPAVDGIALDRWLADYTDNKPYEPNNIDNVRDLTLALDLYSEQETETVWQYLGRLEPDSVSYVPLLVCPDDVDLTCIVIATEQYVTSDKVIWQRFARAPGAIETQDISEMHWFENVPELIFDKDNFMQVFAELNKSIVEDYRYRGIKINLAFPSRPPKEDWEMIVDSWY